MITCCIYTTKAKITCKLKWIYIQFKASDLKTISSARTICQTHHRIPAQVAKLLHYAEQEAQLEADPNPFALLTLAYLHTRATRSDMDARYRVKCKLIRLLHARQWNSTLIREFFAIIDWMMALPPELETKLKCFKIKNWRTEFTCSFAAHD